MRLSFAELDDYPLTRIWLTAYARGDSATRIRLAALSVWISEDRPLPAVLVYWWSEAYA